MSNLKIILDEAASKLSIAVSDIEDLSISKNHKVIILDVLEELKISKDLINEARNLLEIKNSSKN